MRVLVTGFDPFGGEEINPAWEAVRRLDSYIAGAEIIPLCVPTEFEQSRAVLRSAVDQYQPDIIISVGQAGGRNAITPELIAINYADARIPDNAGYQPREETIHADGQNAYFTQLPVKNMVDSIRDAGLPAQVSTTAGTYVCNYLMYEAQYLREKHYPALAAGFIHISYLPEQVKDKPDIPSLSLNDDVTALTLAIQNAVEWMNSHSPNK